MPKDAEFLTEHLAEGYTIWLPNVKGWHTIRAIEWHNDGAVAWFGESSHGVALREASYKVKVNG